MTLRREFLQAACVLPFFRYREPLTTVLRARNAIRSGELGEIRFCRAFGNPALLHIVQFLFDDPAPLSVTGFSPEIVTYRYPNLVVSLDRSDGETPRITVHGERSTLSLPIPRNHLPTSPHVPAMRRLAELSLRRRETVDWNESL